MIAKRTVLKLSCAFAVLMTSGCVSLMGPSWVPLKFDNDSNLLSQIDTDIKLPSPDKITKMEEEAKKLQSEGRGLVYDEKLELYLNNRLNSLKSGAGLENIPAKIYITAQSGYNVFTTSEGNIYIPLLLLSKINTEDEFDAVISHEFAHVVLGHTSTDIFKSIHGYVNQMYTVFNALQASETNNISREIAEKRIRNSMLLYKANESFVTPIWNRDQEDQADKLAIDILVKNNKNVDSMTAFFNKLSSWEKLNEQQQQSDLKHISLLVEKLISDFDVSRLKQGNLDIDKEKVVDALFAISNDFFESNSQSHPDVSERKKSINQYVRSNYRFAPKHKQQVAAWNSNVKNNRINSLNRSFRNVVESDKNRSLGRTKTAAQKLNQARSSNSLTQSFYNLSLAELNYENRNYKNVLNVKNSTNLKYPSFKLDVLRANAEYAINKNYSPDRLAGLYESYKDYGEPLSAYQDFVILSDMTDNKGIKNQLVMGCRAKYMLSMDSSLCAVEGNDKLFEMPDVFNSLSNINLFKR